MAASEEIMRAFSEVAPEVIGKRRWRKLVFAVHRELEESIPVNGCGPVVAARKDAVMILRAVMRLCGRRRG